MANKVQLLYRRQIIVQCQRKAANHTGEQNLCLATVEMIQGYNLKSLEAGEMEHVGFADRTKRKVD